MSIEENKAIVRRYIEEVYNGGNAKVIDELIDPGYVHYARARPVWSGPQGTKEAIATWFSAFPDMYNGIEDVVAEGDKVVVRLSFRGTHTGTMLGHPPTGKEVATTEIVIFRLTDGKIVETWEEWDARGFFLQISGASSE